MTAAELLARRRRSMRSDKDAATLGERFCRQEGGEIEGAYRRQAVWREFIDRIFPEIPHAARTQDPLSLLRPRRGSEAMTLGEDRPP